LEKKEQNRGEEEENRGGTGLGKQGKTMNRKQRGGGKKKGQETQETQRTNTDEGRRKQRGGTGR